MQCSNLEFLGTNLSGVADASKYGFKETALNPSALRNLQLAAM